MPTSLIDLVIFGENGSSVFPLTWTRKQKKRISYKISKKRKQGHVFPITDLMEFKMNHPELWESQKSKVDPLGEIDQKCIEMEEIKIEKERVEK